jgi:hypothetical protein
MSDKDTDPSTPQSLRPAERLAAMDDSTGPTPRPKLSTDPGVGPPSAGAPPGRSMAIIVPPPSPGFTPKPPGVEVQSGKVDVRSPTQSKKDSVELLLEGMTGPRPDRTKTMPQSDGQAAAAYHAQHGVRPARTVAEREPKVLVDRWPLSVIRRDVRPSAQGATEPSPRLARGLGRPVATAIFAALVVVVALFVVMKVTSAAHTSNERAGPVPEPVAVVPAAPVAVSVAVSAAQAPTAEAPVEAPPVAVPAPSESPPPAAKPRRMPARPTPAAASSKLGEFKTTF